MESIGYRAIRTTTVLAKHSAWFSSAPAKLQKAVDKVISRNFDLQRVDRRELEMIYGYFDDETFAKVKNEFEFMPSMNDIRDNGTACAHCSLCGKGDSRDDGANEDKIRYEFRLTNVSGGQEVWCGSTCIINYGIKVRGAQTAEEAKLILERTLRQYINEVLRERWRQCNPDHTAIPDLFEKYRSVRLRFGRYGRYDEAEIGLLGFSYYELLDEAERLYGGFRSRSRRGEMNKVVNYYLKTLYLTPMKEAVWRRAQKLDRLLTAIDRVFDEAPDIWASAGGDKSYTTRVAERIAFFTERGKQIRASLPQPKQPRRATAQAKETAA